MRNLVIAFFMIAGLIWLFFTVIFLDNNSKNEFITPSDKENLYIKKSTTDNVDIKNLALLLGVEYQEKEIAENTVNTSTTLEVEVDIVVIYTSENNHKIRIRTDIDGEKTQRDMKIGDKLYNYVLTTIKPSYAELDNGENKIILKAFKSTIISVTNLPKELPDSL